MAIYDAGTVLNEVLHKRGRWGASNSGIGVYTGDCNSLGLNPNEKSGATEQIRTQARAENDVIRARRELIERIRPQTVQIFMLWNRIEPTAGIHDWVRTDDMMNWLEGLGVGVWVMFGYPPRHWTQLRAGGSTENALFYRTCLNADRSAHVSGSMAALRTVLTEAMRRYGSTNRRLIWSWEEEMDNIELYGSRVATPAHTNSAPPPIHALYKELQQQFAAARTAAGNNDWLAISSVTGDAYGPTWFTDFRWVEYLRQNGTLDLVDTIPMNCYGFDDHWTGSKRGLWYDEALKADRPGGFEHYGVITMDPPIVNKLKWIREQTKDPITGQYHKNDHMQIVNLGASSFSPMNYKIELTWMKPGSSEYQLVPATHIYRGNTPAELAVYFRNGTDPQGPAVPPFVYRNRPIDFDGSTIPQPDVVDGQPLPLIDPDKFAAVLTANIKFDVPGEYRFKLRLNGRAKMYVDGGSDVFGYALWNAQSEIENEAESTVINITAPTMKACNIHYYHLRSATDTRQAAGDWLIKNYAHMFASRHQGKTRFRLCTVFNLEGKIDGSVYFGLLNRLMQESAAIAAGDGVKDPLDRMIELGEKASFVVPFSPQNLALAPRSSTGGYRFTLSDGTYLFIYWNGSDAPIVDRTYSPT